MKNSLVPWQAINGEVWQDTVNPRLIAQVKSGETYETDAKLLAASPELYQAVKLIMNALDRGLSFECIDPACKCEGNDTVKDAVEACIKAINKVEG